MTPTPPLTFANRVTQTKVTLPQTARESNVVNKSRVLDCSRMVHTLISTSLYEPILASAPSKD